MNTVQALRAGVARMRMLLLATQNSHFHLQYSGALNVSPILKRRSSSEPILRESFLHGLFGTCLVSWCYVLQESISGVWNELMRSKRHQFDYNTRSTHSTPSSGWRPFDRR